MDDQSRKIDTPSLSDLRLDMAAVERVLTCQGNGLRNYALAGGLDPAQDFRGLDLCGWDLAGQDLSGFDFSDCDLRGTGIEYAIVDTSTRLDGAVLDDSVVAGQSVQILELDEDDLKKLVVRASDLYEERKWSDLAVAGANLLPLLESRFGTDHPELIRLAGYIGCGEQREGDPAAGLARLNRVLAAERARGTEESEWRLLLWRFHVADALLYLGRAKEALEEHDALLPLYIKGRGAEDPGTLATRSARAHVLLHLGRAKEALEEYNVLLPLAIERWGAENPRTLATRYRRACAVLDLGRPKEALEEYDALLPLLEKVRGEEDTNTLSTRYMRARALLDLGRLKEARSELTEVISSYTRAKGDGHWWVSIAKSEEIGCRMALGAFGVSDELRRVSEHITKECYPHHYAALRTRYRLARALIAEGEPDLALLEIDKILSLASAHVMTDYRYVEATKRLAAIIGGADNSTDLPY